MSRFNLSIVTKNALGALLTFFYFAYVGPGMQSGGPQIQHYLYFVAGTALLFVITITLNARWARPLDLITKGDANIDDLDPGLAEEVKRKALNQVPVIAGTTFLAWVMAGFLFGLVQPAVLQSLFGVEEMSIVEGLHMFMGITCVGGTITSVFVFFSSERVWRMEIPRFFPEGELGGVKGALKLSVRTRLLIVFLMISLVPLILIGGGSYARASALLAAESMGGQQIVSNLMKMVLFFVVVGVGVSVGLSVLVSQSVSKPLQDMELAMKEVAAGNLDIRIPVVSNDEIGTLGEGFNQMIRGLKESQFVKESFGKYVSQEVRDEILKGKIPLDGEMRRVTLLFSDLRDFTPFVERTHPKDVVTIMNQYFSEMTEAIKEKRGLVLQYVGDEIEAVFGAPVAYDDHPDMAVQAALDMRRRLLDLNKKLAVEGLPTLHHGIGIHTGAVLAGNIGSRDRVSYTLIGDTVNLASRISGLTKDFSWDVILSQTTRDLLTRAFATERLPPVKVKGKRDEIAIYKLAEA
jgi:class 3 adenylate cyclase